jgi:hypothetical protein
MFCTPLWALGMLFGCDLPEQHDLTGATTGTGAGGGCCLTLLLQQLPPWATGAGAAFGLQQLDTSSFRVGSMRGVELALEGGEASLLALRSVGVLYDDVSVSLSWLALIAFSNEAGCIALDFRFGFEIRLLPATATDCARSEGQAHSEVLGIV